MNFKCNITAYNINNLYMFSILTYLIFTYLLLFLISGFIVLLALIFAKCATSCIIMQEIL